MNPKQSRRLAILCVILTTGSLLTIGSTYACQVPVFRYALERWNADLYQVYVLKAGQLTKDEAKAVEILQAKTKTAAAGSRIRLQVVDPTESKDPRLVEAWKNHPDQSAAMLVAFYPRENDAPHSPAYTGKLTVETAAALVDSPVRRAIAERLQAGASAVWVFVPSGDKAVDQAAYDTLQRQIKLDADWLQLPSAEELEVKPELLAQCKIQLKIDFSIVTLDPSDAAEQFLLESLLNSESDLKSFDGPFAFPVFGRGRVLYGLVGKGIAQHTIRSASSFMVGPCSCQVKNQNPGLDLLMMTDWDEAVGATLISEPIEATGGDNRQPTLLTIPPGRNAR